MAFDNFLNNFNKSDIIHYFRTEDSDVREFSNWSKVTHSVEADPGIKPRTI